MTEPPLAFALLGAIVAVSISAARIVSWLLDRHAVTGTPRPLAGSLGAGLGAGQGMPTFLELVKLIEDPLASLSNEDRVFFDLVNHVEIPGIRHRLLSFAHRSASNGSLLHLDQVTYEFHLVINRPDLDDDLHCEAGEVLVADHNFLGVTKQAIVKQSEICNCLPLRFELFELLSEGTEPEGVRKQDRHLHSLDALQIRTARPFRLNVLLVPSVRHVCNCSRSNADHPSSYRGEPVCRAAAIVGEVKSNRAKDNGQGKCRYHQALSHDCDHHQSFSAPGISKEPPRICDEIHFLPPIADVFREILA